MIMLEVAKIEGILNILSSIGILFYLVYILRNAHRTIFESRVFLMLGLFFLLFLTRGINYVEDYKHDIPGLVLSLSILLPLAGVYFVEALMRRHMPLWLKLYSFFGSAGLLVFLFVNENKILWLCIVIFQLTILLTLIGVMMLKKEESYSKEEKFLKDRVAIGFMFSVPFFFTDYAKLLDLPMMRLGCIGGLIFTLACLRFFEENPRKQLTKLLSVMLLQDALGALVFCKVITGFTLYNFTVIFALAVVCHFIIAIFNASFFAERNLVRNWTFKVINEWAPGLNIVDHMNSALAQEGTYAFGESDLKDFDLKSLKEFLKESNSQQITIDYLKTTNQNYATEQLTYLLEMYQNNSLLILNHEPLIFLSMNNPTITRYVDFDKEQVLLSRFVQISLGKK